MERSQWTDTGYPVKWMTGERLAPELFCTPAPLCGYLITGEWKIKRDREKVPQLNRRRKKVQGMWQSLTQDIIIIITAN